MNKLLKKLLTNWVLKNYPFMVTTQVDHFKKVLVKKGKIREYRVFDSKGNRLFNTKYFVGSSVKG